MEATHQDDRPMVEESQPHRSRNDRETCWNVRGVTRLVLAAVAVALAACAGGTTAAGHPSGGATRSTAPASPPQTAVETPSTDPGIAQLAGLPDIPIGEADTPPSIGGDVRYEVSLLRPLFTVVAPGTGWGAQQYANKPVVNADFILHPELGDNPDGVISFIGGLGRTQTTSPAEYVDEERTLEHQQLGPVTAGTIDGVASVDYEADVRGGDVVSSPEFSVPAGWRLHLAACDVGGHTLAVVYAAPQAKFATFAPTARAVLASVAFVQ